MNRRVFGLSLGWLALPGCRGVVMSADVRIDRSGDPLPQRVRFRFGTLRFWNPVGGWIHGVNSLAVSPDGRLVATGGLEPPVVLWDLATGREVRRLGHANPRAPGEALQQVTLHGIAFTPDGSVLAAGGLHGRVNRWEVATGRALAPFQQGHRSAVLRVAFAGHGKVLVTGDQDGLVLVRDPDTGQVRHRLGPHRDHVAVLAISGDGRTVISGGWNQSRVVSVWNATTGRLVRELEPQPFDPFDNESIALAPDGALVAVGREGYEVVVWDVRTGKIVATLAEKQDQDIQEGDPHEVHDEVSGLAFSPDGKTLASAGRDSSVRLWDVATWTERQRLDWHEGEAEAIAFAPDGTSLVAAGSAGVVRIWALPEGRERVRTTGHRAGVSQLAWSPDRRSIVSVGGDDAVCVIDATSGEQVRREVLLPQICYAIDLTPDGLFLAYQGLRSDRRVSVLEASTGRLVRVVDLRSERGGVLVPRLSADGRTLFVGDAERGDERGLIMIYDLATGKELRRIEAEGYIMDLKVSPDGRFLVTHWCNSVNVYDVATGRLRYRLEHKDASPDHDVYDLAFSPVAALLATAGRDGRIRIWELSSGRALRSLESHPTGVSRVVFSPDGKTLASASFQEPVVRLHEGARGREVDRLEGHRAGVCCLAFAPDGRRLATGSVDTTVLVWEL
jgi:WD40 repeat protein